MRTLDSGYIEILYTIFATCVSLKLFQDKKLWKTNNLSLRSPTSLVRCKSPCRSEVIIYGAEGWLHDSESVSVWQIKKGKSVPQPPQTLHTFQSFLFHWNGCIKFKLVSNQNINGDFNQIWEEKEKKKPKCIAG